MNLTDLFPSWDKLPTLERIELVRHIRRDRRVNKYKDKEKKKKTKKVSKDLDAILQLDPDKAQAMLKRFQARLENGQ